jgi:hypothetical protein
MITRRQHAAVPQPNEPQALRGVNAIATFVLVIIVMTLMVFGFAVATGFLAAFMRGLYL